MFDYCVPDCELCDGVGWICDHIEGCLCRGCDETHPQFDPRAAMSPCPNMPYLIVQISEPREVEAARRYGFIVEA